ncbi:MAG TPA: YkvA family protein [Anaerolineaceae bacterium]|nr:YkvA family protein [Anaerolineaceae bacterium]
MTRKAYSPGQDQVKQAVNRARNRAEDYLKDPDRSKRLLEQAVRRANDREGTGGAKADFWTNLKAFFRLTRAYLRGQYTTIPWGSVVMVVAAILYFVSPLDLMPDWFPLAGYVDDAAVLVFVLRQIGKDLQCFVEWESHKEPSEQIIDV